MVNVHVHMKQFLQYCSEKQYCLKCRFFKIKWPLQGSCCVKKVTRQTFYSITETILKYPVPTSCTIVHWFIILARLTSYLQCIIVVVTLLAPFWSSLSTIWLLSHHIGSFPGCQGISHHKVSLDITKPTCFIVLPIGKD